MNKKAKAIHYDAVVRAAVPHLKEALIHRAKCAWQIMTFLNAAGIKAQNGRSRTEAAVLKARRHLMTLGLDSGPLGSQAARDNRICHDQRRAALKIRLKNEGAAYGLEIAISHIVSPLQGLLKPALMGSQPGAF